MLQTKQSRDRYEAAKPFLEKILAGELAKQTAAKMLSAARPDLFASREIARSFLRHMTGSNGTESHVREQYRLTIAEGLERMGKPVLERPTDTSMTGKVGVISDVHLPYHDAEALETALNHLADEGVEHLLLLGDIIDFFGISRFVKATGKPTISQEIKSLRAFLATVREIIPGRIVYVLGNHEERLQTYLFSQVKELADLDALRFENLIGADEFGVEVINGMVHLGKLIAIHGHEVKSGIAPPVNPARGMFLRAKTSTISGHQHQPSTHSEGDLHGNRHSCWSLGCLCGLSPDYNRFAFLKWDHGFAVVDVEESGRFSVYNHRILDGKVRPA